MQPHSFNLFLRKLGVVRAIFDLLPTKNSSDKVLARRTDKHNCSHKHDANDDDAQGVEPHYDVITAPDQVQIYEPIMGDTAGNVTTTLLLASQYLKDNRILPQGYNPATAPIEIVPWGDAATDSDFVGGSDRVTYQVPVTNAAGLTIEVEMVYQTLGYRWAENLREYADPVAAPEIVDFLRYYEAVPNTPEFVTSASVTLP